LKQICYFLTLVQAGNNFTEAAKQLGIKQPPLTQRIQALEELLSVNLDRIEVKLFDRSKRPIELTVAGRVFLTEIELALMHLDRAIEGARSASQGKVGRLRIGFYTSFAAGTLPKMVREFQQEYPDVQIELSEIPVMQKTELIKLLKQQQLDIIFHNSFDIVEEDLGINVMPILSESFIIVLPETHALAKLKQICLKALIDEVIILPDLDALPFYRQIITRCQELGFEPKITSNIKVAGIFTILSLVASGMGVAILPSHIQVLSYQGVVYRSIQDSQLTRQAVAIWRDDDTSIVLRQFLALIKKQIN
jgi:DNA-binding transcriptional LysR family regulator